MTVVVYNMRQIIVKAWGVCLLKRELKISDDCTHPYPQMKQLYVHKIVVDMQDNWLYMHEIVDYMVVRIHSRDLE